LAELVSVIIIAAMRAVILKTIFFIYLYPFNRFFDLFVVFDAEKLQIVAEES
jgi:hypothetical protein